LPTPCARDGKGRGYQRGLPDLIEHAGIDQGGPVLLPPPTATTYGSNQSASPGAAVRPSLARIAGQLLPTPTAADARSSANATAGRRTPMVGHAGHTLTDATRFLPTPRTSDGRGPAVHGEGGADLRTIVAYLPTPRATDGTKGCPAQRGSKGDLTLPSAAVTLDPASTGTASGDPAAWGPYADAVARWAAILGRPAPAPTQTGTHGKPVLAPGFVEWLMGLPEGWACGLGLPRTVALKVLGNGVVPHQAAAALRALLVRHHAAVTP
jgi:hypothetical protein